MLGSEFVNIPFLFSQNDGRHLAGAVGVDDGAGSAGLGDLL